MPDETAQQKQQENIRWQTYSNRDYLNKIYVDKYETCIYFMVDAISPNPLDARKVSDEVRQLLFKKSLASSATFA